MPRIGYSDWKEEMENMIDDQLAMLAQLMKEIQEEPSKIGILADTLIDKIRKLKQNYVLYYQGKQLQDHLIFQIADGQPSIQSKRRIRAKKRQGSYAEKVKEEMKEYE